MTEENRKCENCGRKMPRASYVPFNGGMIVCLSCYDEWENLGSPNTIAFTKAGFKDFPTKDKDFSDSRV